MTTGIRLAGLCLAITSGVLFGQEKVKPIKVCEALAGLKKLGGKPIAIVERIECGSSLIDHVCFLAEDRCQQPLMTDGYAWPTPPAMTPETDQATLVQKLIKIRKATTLGLHKEPRFKTEGQTITFSHFADADDEWGMAYGVFFTTPKR